MRTSRRPSRLVAVLAAGSLMLAPLLQAQADTATATASAQAGPDAAAPAGGSADLPSRVGRLAAVSGTVSFHTADEDHWDPATLNYPVTSGDAFWTEPQASASIEIAASRIDMASTTEFDVDTLDDHTLTATQAQGETFLDLRDMQPNETLTIRTPRGSVAIAGDGQYEVASGDTQTPTTVTVVTGAAQVSGDSVSLPVAAGQTATIIGSGGAGDPFRGSVAAAQRDEFLVARLAAAKDVAAQSSVTAHATVRASASASVTAAAPAVVRQMPGGSDLSSYGDWQDTGQYGRVWYPEVARDWVPYRDGHWAFVAPWGWTWIDDEPWGYAPFHYGRWIRIADRWGWAPIYAAPGFVVPAFYRPVYAPALVGFFGVGAALAAGLAIGGRVGFGFGLGFGGFGYGHIGWCPLGWGEPFRPWFAGPGYFDRVNRFDVANIRNVSYNNSVHDLTINNFANAARGATVVPTSAMLDSQRAAGIAEPFSRAQFAEAHPVSTVPRPAAEAAATLHGAPGPGLGAGVHSGLALRTAAAHTVAAPRVAAAALAHNGLPALRSAGANARAVGGAPGPAFTPRTAIRTADASGALAHAAPGPAISRGGAPALGAAAHAALPTLRSHAAVTTAALAGGRRPVTSHATPFHTTPAYHSAARPQFRSQHDQLPQHYQLPQRYQPTQRYQPAQHYAAPQSQYRAPSSPAPARHFTAPAARPAPANGRRPWPP